MVYVKKYRNKRDFWVNRFISVHGDTYIYDDIETIYSQSDILEIGCRKHGKFRQSAKMHYRGQGCPICGKERAYSYSKGNWQHFIDEAEKRFPGRFEFPFIETEYENSHSKITVKCKRDGNVFTKIACDFITSVDGGCRECYKESFCKYYTYEELQNKTKFILKPFEGKVEERQKVIVICPKHGEYEVNIRTLLKGDGKCKACANTQTEEHFNEKKNEFITKDKEIYNGKFSFNIDDYKGWTQPMLFTCNDCGHTFTRTPMGHVSHGFKNCSKCAAKIYGEERTKTNDQFVAESQAIFGDEFGYDRCQYTKSNNKVILFCKKCGKYFEVEANAHLTRHQGCPYHYRNRSKAEDEIIEYLKTFGVDPYYGYRELLEDRYELDIFDEENMFAIEYDGIFWHNENNKPRTYHLNKSIECEEKGVRLIHIFEDEWKNKKKQDIWKSMLANIYKKTPNKIYARNCEIKYVDKRECYDFLDDNHLQGKCASKIRFGLYYNGELVSVMTFGSPRHFIGGSNHQYELLRFCSKKYTSVVGGADKLFKFFVKQYSPNSIVSYADRRWSTGGLYEALGFKLYNKSRPNYYYVIKNERKNRFNFRKKILIEKYGCPEDVSEHDFCKSQGWYRIYDCGSLCYEWKNE